MTNKQIANSLETLLRMMEIQAQTNEEVFARIRSLENAMAGFAEDSNGDLRQDEMEREARQTMEDMSIPPSKR
jgi:predicted protein tyrosine phosphatase